MVAWRKAHETLPSSQPYERTALTREIAMLRTVFTIGLFAVLGLLALKLVFGIFGPILALFFALLILALKIAFFGFLVFLVIRLVSPDTARKIRERWSGGSY